MTKPILQFRNVSFDYLDNPILRELDFSIRDGELISIIGPSGSGKTTLFRLITGLEQAKAGEIVISGNEKAGYMPQQDLLMPWRTILDNAALPLELQGVKKTVAHEQVRTLLGEFGLAGVEHQFPGELSGGMKQRVSFLRAILTGANILLLDEPFSALDAITRLSMQEWLLDQWQKWQKTILFITHDVDEALFLSDRILLLKEKPMTKLQSIEVPLERPRTIRDLNKQKVVTLKEQLINQLRVNR